MHVVQSTICKPSMDATRLQSASWSPLFTPCKLKLMACLLQPRMQRRNPRRPWWMLHALPTSLEPSRIMQHLWGLPRTLLETNLESLKVVLRMLKMLPWLRWRERSVSLRPSLHLLSLALGKHLRLSRGLKRLQLSTWQSSGRLNKSLRKLKREQSLLWSCKLVEYMKEVNLPGEVNIFRKPPRKNSLHLHPLSTENIFEILVILCFQINKPW